MTTGQSLVNSVWGAFGVVIIFAAVIVIIFKFFIGQSRNVGAGVGALIGVGAVAFLASQPQIVMNIGQFLLNLVGISA